MFTRHHYCYYVMNRTFALLNISRPSVAVTLTVQVNMKRSLSLLYAAVTSATHHQPLRGPAAEDDNFHVLTSSSSSKHAIRIRKQKIQYVMRARLK